MTLETRWVRKGTVEGSYLMAQRGLKKMVVRRTEISGMWLFYDFLNTFLLYLVGGLLCEITMACINVLCYGCIPIVSWY